MFSCHLREIAVHGGRPLVLHSDLRSSNFPAVFGKFEPIIKLGEKETNSQLKFASLALVLVIEKRTSATFLE